MLYRYDFHQKLDLVRFKKQAIFYIGKMTEVIYHFYTLHYKMHVEIVRSDESTSYFVTISILELERDEDNELVSEVIIIPLIDMRFKEFQEIKDTFQIDNYKAHFDSNSVEMTVDKICRILKIIHKINNLKAFY